VPKLWSLGDLLKKVWRNQIVVFPLDERCCANGAKMDFQLPVMVSPGGLFIMFVPNKKAGIDREV
jgi:hypothetical protein